MPDDEYASNDDLIGDHGSDQRELDALARPTPSTTIEIGYSEKLWDAALRAAMMPAGFRLLDTDYAILNVERRHGYRGAIVLTVREVPHAE